jgi:hypothetical protein
MEELFSLAQSILQFLLTLLDIFFGTNHSDNDRQSRGGGYNKKSKTKRLK